LEIEFTLRKTDREWIPVEIKPSNTSIHTKHLDDTYLLIPLVKSSFKREK